MAGEILALRGERRLRLRADLRGADTADSARFWFFDPDNTELVVKVLDACAVNDRFWAFASGLTNVEVILQVTDTETGRTRSYYNRQGRAFQPVQDTGAFTCD